MRDFFNKQRCVIALVLLLAAALPSCGAKSTNYFAYQAESFSADLTFTEQERSASCSALFYNGQLAELRYTAPEALAGVAIKRTEGAWQIARGELQHTAADPKQIDGLLRPATLLMAKELALLAVQRIDTGYLLSIRIAQEGEGSMMLSKDGFPSLVTLPKGSLQVENVKKIDA